MCIGFGLCDMFVETDVQLQFYRVVTEFVWFSKRITSLNSFSTATLRTVHFHVTLGHTEDRKAELASDLIRSLLTSGRIEICRAFEGTDAVV